MTITIADLTANVTTTNDNLVKGDGILDDLMETVNTHLAAQFALGRISATEYAKVYLGAMQAALAQGVAYTLGQTKANAETSLLFQKEITEFAQTDQVTKIAPTATSIMGAQAALSIEQAKGFKWNANQKYLKTVLDAWSINISTAGVAATQVDAINAVGVNNINDRIDAAEPTG